jgi:hypothetical protein
MSDDNQKGILMNDTLHLPTFISIENLAITMVWANRDVDALLQFVMTLDSLIADVDFTVRLRDALTESLENEDEEA